MLTGPFWPRRGKTVLRGMLDFITPVNVSVFLEQQRAPFGSRKLWYVEREWQRIDMFDIVVQFRDVDAHLSKRQAEVIEVRHCSAD